MPNGLFPACLVYAPLGHLQDYQIYDMIVSSKFSSQERVRATMEEEMENKDTFAEELEQKLCEGHLVDYIECLDVDYKSTEECSYCDLLLDVKGCKDVYASFDKYVEVERLEGSNKYHAEGNGLQDAKKGVLFIDFPPILQLQLKRFEYDVTGDTVVKINDRYEFPIQLDLDRDNGKYLSVNADKNVRNLYSLYGVLVHSGEVDEGLYSAHIRPTLSDTWYKFDGELVMREEMRSAVEEQYGGEEELSQNRGCSNAYMLIYVRENDKEKWILDEYFAEFMRGIVEDTDSSSSSCGSERDSSSSSSGKKKRLRDKNWRTESLPSEFTGKGGPFLNRLRKQKLGFCWAMATCFLLESVRFIVGKDEILRLFSMQHLINHCKPVTPDNHDISYGYSIGKALVFIRDHGITEEAICPFKGERETPCIHDEDVPLFKVDGVARISEEPLSSGEKQVAEVVALHPVGASMYSNKTLKKFGDSEPLYFGNEDGEKGVVRHFNHAVTVVGYGRTRARKFWRIATWGEHWGNRGLGRVCYNSDNPSRAKIIGNFIFPVFEGVTYDIDVDLELELLPEEYPYILKKK